MKAWAAVRDLWRSNGEAKFAEDVQRNFIKRNFGWTVGHFGFGVPQNNNALESFNRFGLRDGYKIRQKVKYPKLAERTTFSDCLRRIIWGKGIFGVSLREIESSSFEEHAEVHAQDIKVGRSWAASPLILWLNKTVACWKSGSRNKLPRVPMWRIICGNS